jgi:threonine dehydrogenase-like Zn-dependent dehydrogenase
MLCAAVCGTDIQIARGERPDAAAILGHEGVGAIGGRSDALVVFNPVDPADQDRILGHTYDGVFRPEFPLGHVALRPGLVRVPRTLELELCSLCEPVATALYGWELIDVAGSPMRVGVWGAGPVGLVHAHLALLRGLSVLVVHPEQPRLEWAAAHLLGREPMYATPGSMRADKLDAAFLCTDRVGTEVALAEAIGALRDEGVLILVGGIPRGYKSPLLPDVDLDAARRANVCGAGARKVSRARTTEGKVIAVAGHRGTSPEQICAAHALISSKRAFFNALITHVVDPLRAAALINARCNGHQRDEFGHEIVKVVVRYTDLA